MLMMFNCNISDLNVSLKPTDTLFLDIQSVFLSA